MIFSYTKMCFLSDFALNQLLKTYSDTHLM